MKKAAAKRGRLFKFPTTKEERFKAIQNHLASRQDGGKMHYFTKDDGSIHYIDNKGNGNYGFIDLATKLSREAQRKAKKFDATPTLNDFIEVWGEDKGKDLFETEQKRLLDIYKKVDSRFFDVDHMDSLAKGGLHYSRNLRALLSAQNRAEGARYLTDELRNAYMLAQTKKEQLMLQGPPVPEPLLNIQEMLNRLTHPETYARAGKRAASRAVPYAGTGLSGINLFQRIEEFVHNPTFSNGAQIVASGAETVANGVGDVALTLDIPLAAVAAENVANVAGFADEAIDVLEASTGP
tara:strand:- start:184 stop:1068 length:885 start_codon:yes stop_codon:yes gene_type:complete